ncbi:AzlD domain-containing protein [Compostimonas suwonensis]|uniref:Branched-subunit amino acid transport protein AzlD n=1 Tax=Compostimonas suwonensis TaxID=1048394 RepID=A0A2M9BZ10_9MICO|nr:AzlD domain-containing protein [Compostimonas suwonensis]PJJ63319.1 branched-subunit amino acid transport protein AzlD [Compostimonas suwonensis]
MNLWQIVIIASIACLVIKLAGYLVPPHWLEKPRPARIADLLTVALLAALIGVQTLGAGQAVVVDARLPAVIVAAGLYALRVPFIVVVIAAALVAAALRAWAGFA